LLSIASAPQQTGTIAEVGRFRVRLIDVRAGTAYAGSRLRPIDLDEDLPMPARRLLPLLFVVIAGPAVLADDRTRVFSENEKPTDRRLGKLIDLNKSYFPFTPPTNKHAWEERRVALRRQIQVAEGLWPMPERGPVKATIHGPINRDGYTVEKV